MTDPDRPPPPPTAMPAEGWRFGLFVLQPGHGLWRGGRPVPLGGRALDLLGALVQAGGAVVDKRALMQAAWPRQVVVENALHQHMRALRLALGDQAALLQAVPRRGYRLAATVEPLASGAEAQRPRLPPAPWPLRGRDALLAEAAPLLVRGRCTTLLGMAGVGKTRLALELARQRDAAGGTVVWCDLAGPARDGDVPAAIARALGLPGPHGAGTLPRIALALRDAELLLVLDNCEHLVAGCADAAQTLLAQCPGLALLATSQRPLGLPAEQRRQVPPLPVPDDGQDAPALQLLLERVESAGGPPADAAMRALAAELCRRLEGVPLALELAAARVAALGWQATRDGIADHFRLLAGGPRAGAARHRSLEAALAWSCELLPPRRLREWASLAVFRGGWALDGAAAVLGLPADDVAAVLADLVERSLVQRIDGTAGPRFTMHEAQRLHAATRLARSTAAAEVARRHGRYLAERTERAYGEWDRRADTEWLAEHGGEFDNLVAAVRGALQRGDRALAARLVGAGIGHWQALGEWPLAEALLDDPVLQAGPPAGAPDATEARLQLARALALLGEGSEPARLRRAAEAAVAAADTALAPRERAQARLCVASAAARAGVPAAQDAALDQAQALLEPDRHGKTWGWLCSARGWALQLRGELAPAREAIEQARRAWQDCGAGLDECRALVHLADLRLATGDVAGALATGAEAVARLRGWRQRELWGRALANLGAAQAAAGQHDAALHSLVGGLEVLQGTGFGWWVFDHLAALAAERGQALQAARWLGHADAGYARHRAGRRLHNEARAHAAALERVRTALAPAVLTAALQAGATADESALLREAQALAAG